MEIKLLGVRGSLPAPLRNTEYRAKLWRILELSVQSGLSRVDGIDSFIESLPDTLQYTYGGNTTCVSIVSEKGNLYIIDCGTGIRPLGDELLEKQTGASLFNIFITHTHWDHIQGLPFFKPLYMPGSSFRFHSPYPDLDSRLERQMAAPYFPATFSGTASSKSYHLLQEGVPLELEEGLTVDIYPLRHPGDSYAYRFREGNRIFIFATDTEFTGEMFESSGVHTDFFLNADLLLIDSQYTLDESFKKFDWGHTSYTAAVNCGIRWNARTIALTHHEPAYDDNRLTQILEQAVRHRNLMKLDSPDIIMAREGMIFRI